MSFFLSCTSNASPVMEVSPKEAMIDEPVSIRILKCPNHELIKLVSTAIDDDGVKWKSINTFMPSNGVVDLASTSPVSGSYNTIDAMGFMWSMRPMNSKKSVLFSCENLKPLNVKIQVYLNDVLVSTSNLSRLRVRTDVHRTEIREKDLVGTIFIPKNAANKPGIIDLTGSGGGLIEARAALLASHGYVTFALAYFGSGSLPKTLSNIPLEYFEKAIHYLQQQKGVDSDRIGIVGNSRGGELSLLLGSTYSEIKCVIGYLPSIFRWPGTEGPVWTLDNRPLPFISQAGDTQLWAEIQKKITSGGAISLTPWFKSVIQNREALRESEILVENINGPILLISGQDDKVWPSALFSEFVIQRLKANNFKHQFKHLTYPNAGHSVGPPYRPITTLEFVHPISGVLMELGGTATGNAHACADSWQQLLLFLKESFN